MARIYAQTDDDLSEANINEVAALANQSNYVVRGLDLTTDYQALEVDVSAGFCTILNSQQLYRVFPDATTKTLSDNETHEVFVRIDPATQDDVSVVITTDGSSPTDPSLKIGDVDTNNDTTTETNRNPSGTFESVNTGQIDSAPYRIDSSGSIIFESSVSDLVSNLSAGDYAFIPSGTYDPIEISTDSVTIECANKNSTDGVKFNASVGDSVTISGNRVTMSSFLIDASGSSGEHGVIFEGSTGSVVKNCRLSTPDGNHIRFDSNTSRSQVALLERAAAAGGDSIVFENGASNNIVDQYANAGTITDNDGSNATGTTT